MSYRMVARLVLLALALALVTPLVGCSSDPWVGYYKDSAKVDIVVAKDGTFVGTFGSGTWTATSDDEMKLILKTQGGDNVGQPAGDRPYTAKRTTRISFDLYDDKNTVVSTYRRTITAEQQKSRQSLGRLILGAFALFVIVALWFDQRRS